MDEIYQLVRIRVGKVHELNKILQTQSEQLKVEDIRKAKEDEKFRTEKENWILNVLKALKDYTFEQKQILCEKSLDIMKLIWPEFQLKSVLLYDEDFNKRFLDIYLKIFTEFFSPFEQSYEFRLTLRQVARSNNISIVPDMLKYLVEFSRDYFKKFMIYLSIQRNKQIGNNQQGVMQQTQNQNNNQNGSNNQNSNYQPIKQNQRSKSQISNTNYTDTQQQNLKIQLSKVGAVIQNHISETENQNSQLLLKAESSDMNDNNNNIILKKKSISIFKQNEDVKLIGNILKQLNEDKKQQQLSSIDQIHQQEQEQYKENEISTKNVIRDNFTDLSEIQNSKLTANQNEYENYRRKSILTKQTQQQQISSSPLKLIQNKKSIPTEGNFQDEKISPRQTPMNIYNARSPLRQRITNQGSINSQQVQVNLIFNPSIKKNDLSVFPSTLSITWFVSKEKEMKITKQINTNSVISDLDQSNIQMYNDKMKRAKGIDDIKLVYIQIFEQSKQRNMYINSTVQNYNEKYKNKYPKKVKQVNEEREKEDRESYANTIQQNSVFQQYYFQQNEDLFNVQKKGDTGNFTQISNQKMFIVKSAATKNRKYNSQVLTPPPSYSSNSTLQMNSSQKTNSSSYVNNQITNQQQIQNSAVTPLQQASNSINSQQNQPLSNNIYNNSNINKPKTLYSLNQASSFSSSTQQQQQQQYQQRNFSPQKYHKIDHTNLQNKLKIIRLTNSRCNSALMRPKIIQNSQNLETNTLSPSEILNNIEEKPSEKIPKSCQEIKMSQKNQEQSAVDQSQIFRQKSSSVIHTKKQSADIQQSFLGDTILQTQQSRNDYAFQGEDFIIKTSSFQELNDEIDDKKFNEENSVMEASFSQQSKSNSIKKIGNAINIQDENDSNQICFSSKTPSSDNNNQKYQSESIIKQKLDGFLDQDLDYDESPQSPTSESNACYFVFSKKKKKSNNKVNEEEAVQNNRRAQSQQSQAGATILKEFNSSPQQNHLKLNKTQKINFKNQNSFAVHQGYVINRDLDQTNSKLFQQQVQERKEEQDFNKQNQQRESAETSSCSSTNSQNNQNMMQQHQKTNKYQMMQNQASYMNGNQNYNDILVSQQQNKLPQINQQNNLINKLNSIQQNGNEIKIFQHNEDENQKNRIRNYQNQPYLKKNQDFTNSLLPNNNANQNLQKEYPFANNQFSSNNINNNQFTNQLQQLNYQPNKNNLYNNSNYQYQQTEDQLRINYPQGLNVMTDKFKNLLLQKINKIKGDKQQQIIEQNGNNQNGVMGGTNGIPLKVLQQTQMQTSILQHQQSSQPFSVSQSKILQKYSNNINQINTNATSSTQPSRINNFNSSQAPQNQDNSKSRPPSNNQLEQDNKQLQQISNTVPIRKSKNISFSVDNQASAFAQNSQAKANNLKIAQQLSMINNNNNMNQDQMQSLIIQPKNSSKDIFVSNQSRQKYQQNSFSNSSKKMNPQKNYSVIQNQPSIQAAQQLAMNANFTNNTQNTQLKAGQNALQNLIGSSNINIQKTANCFNMKLLKVQGNTINNDKKPESFAEKGFKSNAQQDTNKQFTTSLVTQLQPFFQQHLLQQQK